MIFPISVTSFRDLRHAVGFQAAAGTRRLGAKWVRRRPSVNKPASDRQLGIARRQGACQLSRMRVAIRRILAQAADASYTLTTFERLSSAAG